MASQVYFDGDWYECVSPALPGESPSVSPEKWVKLEIPAFLEEAIVELAVGRLQMTDGQSDKRTLQTKEGASALYDTFIRHRPRGDYKPMPVGKAK